MIVDGNKLSDEIILSLAKKLNNTNLALAVILIGDDEASKIYVSKKEQMAKKLGINFKLHLLKKNTKEDEVIKLIEKLNKDKSINGIILQSPTPTHINFLNCVSKIDLNKDVDALNIESTYNNYHNINSIIPCTVKGVMYIFKYYNIDLSGKEIAVVGKGNLVGKPLIHTLLSKGATVTICHSRTLNLKNILKTKDIIISAVGKPNLIKKDMVKKGSIVIDVGISKINNKVVGDVDYKNVSKKTKLISKTPGGVGPLTVAMIFDNLYELSKER